MADDSKTNKTNAEQKKLRQAEDGRKAMLDYEAEAIALRARTERLRALRLEREAAAPPPAKKSPAKKGAKTPAKGSKAGSKAKPRPLSEWLSDQKKDGMRD